MEILKQAYLKIKTVPLQIYGIRAKKLSDYCTTEKDLKKGISRMPIIKYLEEEKEQVVKDRSSKELVLTREPSGKEPTLVKEPSGKEEDFEFV